MKKFITSLIACMAIAQGSYAATTALVESLLEYEAITSAIGGVDPIFQNIIPPTEFIVDIKRLTRQINVLGEVRYGILTRTVGDGSVCECHKHPIVKYIATLNVAPNTGLGPNIVTVLSIVRLHDHDDHHH